MTEPKWTGDMDDDTFLKTADGYPAHAEATDEGLWHCQVTHGDTGPPPFNGRVVLHTAESDVRPLTGKAARTLCMLAIDADRWRQAATKPKPEWTTEPALKSGWYWTMYHAKSGRDADVIEPRWYDAGDKTGRLRWSKLMEVTN